MKKHPIQPIEPDAQGTLRFKKNTIVEYLLDKGAFDLNQLAMVEFPQEDREQFAQLIGYSLDGFSTLSYVTDETYNAAKRIAASNETPEQARLLALEKTLESIREGLRKATTAAFQIHPDDLTP